MPQRTTPLINGELYHVYNHISHHRYPFNQPALLSHARQALEYYCTGRPNVSFSTYLKVSEQQRQLLQSNLTKHQSSIQLICYCIMPNHYHLLVKQLEGSGIANVVAKFQSSLSHHHNLTRHTNGPLFNGRYKATHIATDTQLVHVFLYIILNPYTAGLINSLAKLKTYPGLPNNIFQPYSSSNSACCPTSVISLFPSIDKLWQFITDQADYQRSLAKDKSLLLDHQNI